MKNFLRRISPQGHNGLRTLRTCGLLLLLLALPLHAGAIQNSATGTVNGTALNGAAATVTLQRTAGTAVTSALAEISPPVVLTGTRASRFAYDILPTIQPGDSGLGSLTITAPAGYANLAATTVTVGAMPLLPTCPTPGAGEYCAVATGSTLTVTLGTRVTVDQTPVRVIFTADAPATAGSADFTSRVGASPPTQSTTPGNADGNPANGNNVTVQAVSVDLSQSSFTAAPLIVIADGSAASILTAILRDTSRNPLAGLSVSFTSQRGALDSITQPAGPTSASGTASGAIRSTTPGSTTVRALLADGTPLPVAPILYFTQGQVLELAKEASRKEATIGDLVIYQIQVRNKTTKAVNPVRVVDQIPPNFKYVKGTTYMNGQKVADPSGSRVLTFDLGTVPALADTNGNGRADPGEAGYLSFSYQLVVGSGAVPQEYVNTAVATDVCDQCYISNQDDAKVTVIMDPTFDLATIIGKVFHDKNGNGQQEPEEPGLGKVMVALDNGTYALTDEYGRYHFPAVTPGQRLVKINLQTLPPGTVATTREAQVVPLTPGLLAKANFGVDFRADTETIGRAGTPGMALSSATERQPLQVAGNVETPALLVNGDPARLPGGDARLATANPDEIIELQLEQAASPVEFRTEAASGADLQGWRLAIYDAPGNVVRTLAGNGAPPALVSWDGRQENGEPVAGGAAYQYQLELFHRDGSRSAGARRVFGVNVASAVSLKLTGNAFKTGSAELTDKAKGILQETSQVLKKFTREKILIEGHTDSVGSDAANLDLSRRRAESALNYFVETEQLPRERFTARWFGESRPVAGNDSETGRALNRRVEIKGEFSQVTEAKVLDQYRVEPSATVNGQTLPVDPQGRFATALPDERQEALEVKLANAQGRTVQTRLPLPALEILEPAGSNRLTWGADGAGYRFLAAAGTPGGSAPEGIVAHRLRGRTEPGNSVELEGATLPVAADGSFTSELRLRQGTSSFSLLVRNPDGYTRIANLVVKLSDRDEQGNLLVMVAPIPTLAVKLPPKGVRLTAPQLTVSGVTDPGNTITVNGQPTPLQPDGSFAATVPLTKGPNKVQVTVTDPRGHLGSIEREVEYSDTHFFFLAFADGTVGQFQSKGYLQGAGGEHANEVRYEGRIAYYLKGVIAGKYLVTSALDTGKQEFGNLFKNLDDNQSKKLLTNLDPDKVYPVYGDDSTVVYDTQSQGKFFLAVDSDELHAMIGNYPLALTDTELASYQRTLYGGRIAYQSAKQTSYGQPFTKAVAFGAEVRQAHIRDELSATGGSLYYLSRQEVVEGSEQVSLVVRDKNTGIILSSVPQQQNVDYTIKYDQGRLLFSRPLASVAADPQLINRALLAGNPVSIQVHYEVALTSFDKTAYGGRVRQQLGDHLAIGGTYLKDQLQSGSYQLSGVDSELRFGRNNRLVAEYAQSSGNDALVNVSTDGGLSFREAAPSGQKRGSAWKVAADLDLGEWFGTPDRALLGAYLKRLDAGFRSAGSTLEQGSSTYGLQARYTLTDRDRITARFDWQDFDSPLGALTLKHQDLTSIQYSHEQGRWQLSGELQSRGTRNGADVAERDTLAAARLRWTISKTLSTSLEQQVTLGGSSNNQTTLGVDYQVLPNLALQASGTYGNKGTSAIGGASLTLDQGRIYLKEQLADDQAGHKTTTIVGGERPLGPASKVYSEYQWERAPTGNRSVYLVGAQKQWEPTKGLQVNLAGEQGSIAGQAVKTDRYAVAAGISYTTGAGIRFSSRNEARYEKGGRKLFQYLTSNLLDVKLGPDFTLLGKYRYSESEDLTLNVVEARFEEQSIGLAYRPVKHDRFNALARYTRLLDQRLVPVNASGAYRSVSTIVSGEFSLGITSFLEWVEKAAYKVITDTYAERPSLTSRTLLSISRLNFHLLKQVDASLEYRFLRQLLAKDQLQGWLTELSWEPIEHLRLGVGYNFTDFSDDEFATNDFSAHGWFLRVQGKY